MCGEYAPSFALKGWDHGSSPRVRGIRKRRSFPTQCTRFIPACAGNTLCCLFVCFDCTVHPRVCGEYEHRTASDTPGDGSSPRVRGIPPDYPGRDVTPRFIPACAGNTITPADSGGGCSVHPRVCGEYARMKKTLQVLTGSSPRVRGILRRPRPPPRGTRFIPACAGNTPAVGRGGWFDAVHPRVCGEYATQSAISNPVRGSSPRVRGILR